MTGIEWPDVPTNRAEPTVELLLEREPQVQKTEGQP